MKHFFAFGLLAAILTACGVKGPPVREAPAAEGQISTTEPEDQRGTLF